jgi:hypothetical protein
MPDDREALGRLVRETWVAWAKEQYRPKPSWLLPWEDLDNGQREVDMRIGSAVAAQAVADAELGNERMKAQLFALAAHLPAIRRALTIAAAEAKYDYEAKPYRSAIQALGISEEGADHG